MESELYRAVLIDVYILNSDWLCDAGTAHRCVELQALQLAFSAAPLSSCSCIIPIEGF